MARTSSQTKKQADLLPSVTVNLSPVERWFAYVPDHPSLAGRTYIGRTEAEALINANGDVHGFFKGKVKDIIVRVQD